jgi:hypothetical protein
MPFASTIGAISSAASNRGQSCSWTKIGLGVQ